VTSVQSLINGLEAWLQEELRARRGLFDLLDAQESAVKRAHGEDLERATAAIDAELQAQARRDVRRIKLFEGLAAQWGVAHEALTIASIAERAGTCGARITALRDELAEVAGRVAKKNRRVAALLNAHQRIIGDLLGALIAIQGGDAKATTGALVDAEA
jgi:hypothetical protein